MGLNRMPAPGGGHLRPLGWAALILGAIAPALSCNPEEPFTCEPEDSRALPDNACVDQVVHIPAYVCGRPFPAGLSCAECDHDCIQYILSHDGAASCPVSAPILKDTPCPADEVHGECCWVVGIQPGGAP